MMLICTLDSIRFNEIHYFKPKWDHEVKYQIKKIAEIQTFQRFLFCPFSSKKWQNIAISGVEFGNRQNGVDFVHRKRCN